MWFSMDFSKSDSEMWILVILKKCFGLNTKPAEETLTELYYTQQTVQIASDDSHNKLYLYLLNFIRLIQKVKAATW